MAKRDPITGRFVKGTGSSKSKTSKPKKKNSVVKAATKPIPKQVQYIAFVRDHSGSMSSISSAARKDFNANLANIQTAAKQYGVETHALVVELGRSAGRVILSEDVRPIENIQPIYHYYGEAMTPLYDAVGMAIKELLAMDRGDPNTSFLLAVTTDGDENNSFAWSAKRLSDEIKRLTATDRWTFTFRAPAGNNIAAKLGIPDGNILCWDQTTEGMERAQKSQVLASTQYFASRSAGMGATKSFYGTDLSNVKLGDVKQAGRDITSKVRVLKVKNVNEQIRPFVERETGEILQKGSVFYQLVKTEDVVQDYKRILIRHKATNKIYGGDGIRALLGLNVSGDIKIKPEDHGDYDVFVQSNSVNRQLQAGTDLLVWLGN